MNIILTANWVTMMKVWSLMGMLYNLCQASQCIGKGFTTYAFCTPKFEGSKDRTSDCYFSMTNKLRIQSKSKHTRHLVGVLPARDKNFRGRPLPQTKKRKKRRDNDMEGEGKFVYYGCTWTTLGKILNVKVWKLGGTKKGEDEVFEDIVFSSGWNILKEWKTMELL